MTNYLVILIVLKYLWFLIPSMNTNTLPNYTWVVGETLIKLVSLVLNFHLLLAESWSASLCIAVANCSYATLSDLVSSDWLVLAQTMS